METKTKWILITGEILIIYSTLYIVRSVTTFLTNRALLTPAIYTITAAFGALVVLYLIKLKPPVISLLFFIPVVAGYGVLFLTMKIPVERIHLLEYSLLGFLLVSALKDRWDKKKAVIGSFTACTTAGYVDEVIQYFLPNRVYDLRDVGFNALAGAGGILVYAVLHWIRMNRSQPKKSRIPM